MFRPTRKTDLPPERMTPIRVRGKKGQKARLRALQQERAANKDRDMSPSASTATQGPPLSRLESLPTELLESIFLCSRDVNLPRASLVLGKALSSTLVKHKLCRSLLTDIYGPDEETLLIGKLQSKLLTCRWLDLASVYRALAATMASVLDDILEKPCTGFTKLIIAQPSVPEGHAAPLAPRRATPDPDLFVPSIPQLIDYVFAHPQENGPGHWSIGTSGKPDITITRTSLSVRGTSWQLQFVVRGGCEIPTRLLHGPWTAERLEFLELMMNAGAELDPEGSNNIEVADQSLREAIVQGNIGVVKLLRGEWGFHGRICRIPISLEHIRLAVFQGGCNLEVLEALARTRRNGPLDFPKGEFLDWCQDDILDWANERKERGDQRGRRLLDLMNTLEGERRIGRSRG